MIPKRYMYEKKFQEKHKEVMDPWPVILSVYNRFFYRLIKHIILTYFCSAAKRRSRRSSGYTENSDLQSHSK